MSTATHASTPTLQYQAVKAYRDNKDYGAELAKGIRHIEAYSKEELENKGITKGGKVNAEGVMLYINNHIAKPMLGKRNFDSNDAGYLANFLAIKSLVEQYGKNGVTNDLIERLVATYVNTSTQYIGQKDVQLAGTIPTAEGKAAIKAIAGITGQDITLGNWLDSANDPSEVATRKNALEQELARRVDEAVATGTIDQLIAKVEGTGHGAHATH